jgi:drug/metabolite transporter (DMT)-like permease
MTSAGQERKGVFLAIVSAALWGIFPVMINRGSHQIPPLAFAAISTLLAAIGSLIYMIANGRSGELGKKEAYASLFMITLCIVIIPYTLFFIGSSKTSGINTSMLLLAEIIFTLIFTPFIGEKTTTGKLIGAFGVFTGSALILYNGRLSLNIGDLLVIASTCTYPIGNFYSKKALNKVSPPTILFVRFSAGGLFILILSMLTERHAHIPDLVRSNWPMLLFTGLILLGAGKIIWYEALARLDISKAISLAMTFPLSSLVVLVGIYHEEISSYQWMGIAAMMIGVYFSVKRASVDPRSTKYTPDN